MLTPSAYAKQLAIKNDKVTSDSKPNVINSAKNLVSFSARMDRAAPDRVPSNRLCIPSEQLQLVAELAIFCKFILEDGEQE